MSGPACPPATIRRQRIVEELRRTGYVQMASLVNDLNASTMTIRRDLDALESLGIGSRVRGGLILIQQDDQPPDQDRYRTRLLIEAHLAHTMARAQRALARNDLQELRRLVEDIASSLETLCSPSRFGPIG